MSLMLCKAIYGRLPDTLPATLEAVIDGSVKTGLDLTPVQAWNQMAIARMVRHGQPGWTAGDCRRRCWTGCRNGCKSRRSAAQGPLAGHAGGGPGAAQSALLGRCGSAGRRGLPAAGAL